MRSGCSSFVVVCNLSVIFSLRVFSAETHILAYRAKWCFRRLDPRFVKAAAVRSSGPGESSVTEKPKRLHLLQRASPLISRTMEMLSPAPVPPPASIVVGATIEKRFPGYGVHRGTVAEIDGGKVLTRSSTGGWCPKGARRTATGGARRSAAARRPPPRRRRAPAARAAPSTTTRPSRTTTRRTSSWGRPTTTTAGTRR